MQLIDRRHARMRLLRARRLLRRLSRSRSGVAFLEFALALPIVVPLGLTGTDLSFYAVTQMRLSQAALSLADDASRVGLDTSVGTQQLREVDVNDIFQGLRLQTPQLNLGEQARVTLTSLEQNSDGGQWIHWQRCLGKRRGAGWDSQYNDTMGVSGNGFPGVGPASARITAPPASAVMYVEINYEYRPLIPAMFVAKTKLSSNASFVVRDSRELQSGITNPAPQAAPMTCNLYTE